MGLALENIPDLVTTTQKELGKQKWTDIHLDLQEYFMMPQILQKEKVGFHGGYGIQKSVQVDTSGNAKNIRAYDTDSLNAADIMATFTVPFRTTTTHYIFDKGEILANRSPERILDFIKGRRTDALSSLAEKMEKDGWGKPDDSSDDLDPYGVEYWIVKNATTGFNGGAATGFTTVGGISPTTYPNWRNYTAQYTNVTRTDLVRKMRRAYRQIQFKAPVPHPNYEQSSRYGIYVNDDVIGLIEEVGEAQNENLGRSITSMDGKILFRGSPINWVPQLDSDTDDPVYMLNWGTFHPIFRKGDYMEEGKATQIPNKHRSFVVHTDLTWNTECVNRRRNAVISKGVSGTSEA